ncbi:MAG: hypothetical protein JSV86_01405 [Gemmatimonadota bacterium]|nr:MAG: hypothetical protein JSV86_01405 [Gemmatimonadota bacterium]
MSQSEERKPTIEFPQLDALEAAVRRALRQLEVWRERATASEAERRRLQEVLDSLGKVGEIDASEAAGELEHLRAENAMLRKRLEDSRIQAEKLAREVEFLEDAR